MVVVGGCWWLLGVGGNNWNIINGFRLINNRNYFIDLNLIYIFAIFVLGTFVVINAGFIGVIVIE